MSDTYRALLIKDGEIAPLDLRKSGSGAHHTHELIGNTFAQCFRIWLSSERTIVGYCDDEGLLQEHPTVNLLLSPDLYRAAPPGYPIVGPIVITANDGPDTVHMTDDERSAFYTVDLPREAAIRSPIDGSQILRSSRALHYRGRRAFR